MSVNKKFIALNKVGLHARPAAKFVKYATSNKQNSIWIENLTKQTPRVNAKSFTMVLSISVQQNEEVQITVEGPDAENILLEFSNMFETKFGEEE